MGKEREEVQRGEKRGEGKETSGMEGREEGKREGREMSGIK